MYDLERKAGVALPRLGPATFDASRRNPQVAGYYIEAAFDRHTVYGPRQRYMANVKIWRENNDGSTDWVASRLIPATSKGRCTYADLLDLIDHLEE
ncbi:hypothetical protein [Rubellimicrobium roseum]|uniref:Uncharacterized protein n=1 Tax=Rubellimicrobium roseum TaxID=687525 RepID=A0A5C4N7N7_9RHOB|nr:hypothetical protein [Rubellimicrobium roseum]TNC68778.1 hypothetical protein FHG71_14225 [Rubellimicrobium roseum]